MILHSRIEKKTGSAQGPFISASGLSVISLYVSDRAQLQHFSVLFPETPLLRTVWTNPLSQSYTEFDEVRNYETDS